MPTRRMVLLAGLAAPAAGPAAAEIGETVQGRFIRLLRRAVRENDKAWLAAHAQYPMRVYGHDFGVINSKAEFLARYPVFMTKELRASLLDERAMVDVFIAVWLGTPRHNLMIQATGDGKDPALRIVAINHPG